MDRDSVRGFVNQIVYGVDRVPDLTDDSTVSACVDSILNRRHFSHPAEDYAEAIARTLRSGQLDPQTVSMSRRHSEHDLMDFLRLLARRLDERRPWPRPAFVKRDVAEWTSFAAARPIARIDRPTHQINGILNTSFDQVAVGDGTLPVLILELRSGDVVALMGSVDPRSTTFHLLPRDPGDPDQLIARFLEFTGFSADDLIPVPAGTGE